MKRREFVRTAGWGTGGLLWLANGGTQALAAMPSPPSPNDDPQDNFTVQTTNDLENLTVRHIRDPGVQRSVVGKPLIIYANDHLNAISHWDLLGYSSNLESQQPFISGNNILAMEMPVELAEQFYEVEYRAQSPAGQKSGMTKTMVDQIDRYDTKFTITYNANGSQETVEFYAPNNVVKEVFGWDELPPEAQTVGIDPATEPQAFEQAMTNLYEILTSPEYNLERSMTRNRNTPSPCPDPNPWEETETLLAALGIDPLIQDELYPQGLVLEMTDYTDGKGKPVR